MSSQIRRHFDFGLTMEEEKNLGLECVASSSSGDKGEARGKDALQAYLLLSQVRLRSTGN